MKIAFDIDGTPATFERNVWTGSAVLRVGDEVVKLASPFRVSTHFSRLLVKTWTVRVADHEIEIVKRRQRRRELTPDLLDAEVDVKVDGQVVAQARGI